MPIEAPETKIVDTPKVACDGCGGALGHPRVWLHIPEETGFVECGYCDTKYVLRGREIQAGVTPEALAAPEQPSA